MDVFKDEIYDLDSDLWASVYDDPEYDMLSLDEQMRVNEMLRNVKVTVH